MRKPHIAALCAWITLAAAHPATAQSPQGVWRGFSDDTGSLIYGAAVLEPDFTLSFGCTAPSPQGLPLVQTNSHEMHQTDAFEMYIGFDDRLFQWQMPFRQDGVVVTAGTRPFVLPGFGLNELQGTALFLPMDAEVIRALYDAPSLSLTTPEGVEHSVSVDGLAPALDAALGACIDRWAELGHTIPASLNRYWPTLDAGTRPSVPLPGIPVFDLPDGAITAPSKAPPAAAAPVTTIAGLPPAIPAHVRGMCGGQARIDDSALTLSADFDADGAPDYVIHYTDVRCLPGNRRDLCGAANCSIEVFLSSRAYARPFEFLAIELALATTRDGRAGLRMSATPFICADGSCDGIWAWDGRSFTHE